MGHRVYHGSSPACVCSYKKAHDDDEEDGRSARRKRMRCAMAVAEEEEKGGQEAGEEKEREKRSGKLKLRLRGGIVRHAGFGLERLAGGTKRSSRTRLPPFNASEGAMHSTRTASCFRKLY
ncbi:hypothetical protein DMN91_000110 [Ooceraea biroi]|uniref:Uncharacterized protein n=1 Tax=Ooceraea biroi TaxID=2015173 RepID=A0A3L8E114_OOCBI|nr:hypothetical protein DMN91_000110 [Ooceraea biroi]